MALGLFATVALAESDVIRKQGLDDVNTTMDRLEAILEEKGMTIFARIDHQANGKGVDIDLREAQLLIFGNPKIGSMVMKHDINAGLELPLKVLVVKGDDGNTWLSYRNPQALKKDYDVSECTHIEKMEKALDALTNKALSGE
jgi:uncharacterized protein (DUF302 family)